MSIEESADAQHVPSEIAELHRLARLWGVATRYHDGFGQRREPSPETLVAVLAALGAPVERPADAAEALAVRRRENTSRLLPPSAVAWEGVCPALPLTVPASAAAVPVDGRLVLEAGEAVPFRLEPEQTPVVARRSVDGRELVRRKLRLADPVPPGFHRLEVEVAANRGALRLLSAPLRAHSAPGRRWGTFLPLHALRLREGSGLGDLGALARLARWVGGQGGSVVACLPLLATFLDADRRPFDPSPYAPASRLFWNELWVDLSAVPELPECRTARQRLAGAETVARRRELGEKPEVDYGAERAWRRPVWQALADHFFEHAPESRRRRLDELQRRKPELAAYAAFRAVGDRRGTPWREWPEPLREMGSGDREIPAEELDPAARRLHLYAQLVAHEHMERLKERAGAAGVELHLDLPLGVHAASFDVWRHRSLHAEGVAAGAPPDAFFVRGQNWGFPPLSPERLRRDGPGHFRAVLEHSMATCGLLRLDHGMQMERLFWIPAGADPTEGTYVRYPREELLATLVLESQRTGCAVVGEDLGTVPPTVRRAMDRHGLARMFVLPFELRADPFQALAPVPEGSLAALDTHDTATFAGFWHGRDVEQRRELGLVDEEQRIDLLREREVVRHALTAFLRSQGRLSRVGEPTPEQVGRAALEHLADSPAAWVLVNLEDLWGEEGPQNVPGTGPERANWRRRARRTLAELRSDPEIGDFLRRLDRLRRQGEGRGERMSEEMAPEGSTLP